MKLYTECHWDGWDRIVDIYPDRCNAIPEYINDDFFADISSDWNCNMIRLAMYSEIYCENPEESLSLMKKGKSMSVILLSHLHIN